MSEKLLNKILEKIEQVDTRLQKVEIEQNRHGDHIQQLIQIVGSTNARLEELTIYVHRIQDDTTSLKENQKTIMSIQQDQQKILERLSFRSISQEADIAELRRIK